MTVQGFISNRLQKRANSDRNTKVDALEIGVAARYIKQNINFQFQIFQKTTKTTLKFFPASFTPEKCWLEERRSFPIGAKRSPFQGFVLVVVRLRNWNFGAPEFSFPFPPVWKSTSWCIQTVIKVTSRPITQQILRVMPGLRGEICRDCGDCGQPAMHPASESVNRRAPFLAGGRFL